MTENTQQLYSLLRQRKREGKESFVTLEDAPTTYRVMTLDVFPYDPNESSVFLQGDDGAKWIDETLAGEIITKLEPDLVLERRAM
jgi:hypothetical protein